MNNVQKAIQAIRNIESNEDLNQLVEAFKLQRTYLARSATRSLMVGDIVGFDAKTRGYITGQVTKINSKTIVVRCSTTKANWKVTASAVTPMSIGA
jgi:hypothetical protein|tara:strand:+ start:849 stop:1136 length:288 start_codon:yes stop_codon:yes gene_type:complete